MVGHWTDRRWPSTLTAPHCEAGHNKRKYDTAGPWSGDYASKAVVITTIQLRFDCRSTACHTSQLHEVNKVTVTLSHQWPMTYFLHQGLFLCFHFVSLSVLSVSNFTQKLLIESSWFFFTRDVSLHKEVALNFGSLIRISGSRNCLNEFLSLRDRGNSTLITREVFDKFIRNLLRFGMSQTTTNRCYCWSGTLFGSIIFNGIFTIPS